MGKWCFKHNNTRWTSKGSVFYVAKICCLRVGKEQCVLKPSQFQRLTNPDRYIYIEHGSKNRNGGFYQLHVENKSVSIFKNDSCELLEHLKCLFLMSLKSNIRVSTLAM